MMFARFHRSIKFQVFYYFIILDREPKEFVILPKNKRIDECVNLLLILWAFFHSSSNQANIDSLFWAKDMRRIFYYT